MSYYRKSYEFVVTHSLPCEECHAMYPEADMKPKSSYIYGEGWLKRTQCCQSCFDRLKAAMHSKVRENESW